MTQADAESFLAKAEEYLASTEDNLILKRYTTAAGDAIHAGISAKDATVTALTGTTGKRENHLAARWTRPHITGSPFRMGATSS